MSTPKITNRQLVQLASTYWQWRWLWFSTTTAFAVLGLLYVLFLKGDTWVASQGLIVRDEATGAVMRLGRFESQTQMKAAQETVLEMAKSSQVLSEALTKVGREPSWFSWFGDSERPPTSGEIESMARQGVAVRAPRGAELGTTEVIYLDVMQNSRERAVELNKAACDALEKRLQVVREARANGVISEILASKQAAQENLAKATQRLREMETAAGADLSDLRGLTDTIAGGSSTRQAQDNLKVEIRQAELAVRQIKIDLDTAQASFDDPAQLLLTPTKLVNAQPGLKRLREGLAAARIRSSELQGRYTQRHPLVIAAHQTEQKIRTQLREELGVSVETLTQDLSVATERLQRLKQQDASFEQRIGKLANIRAEYGNVASEVRARNQQLQDAERELAQAEAARDAASTSSLITRIDAPILGENPIGPGRSTILAGVTVSGLFFGFGIVFLLSPLDGNANFGRRRQDYAGIGGRRKSDPSVTVETPSVPAETQAARSRPDTQSKPSTTAGHPTSPTITEIIQQEQQRAAQAESKKPAIETPERLSPPQTQRQPAAANTTATDSNPSVQEAQAVIAAALSCSYSDDAAASPKRGN